MTRDPHPHDHDGGEERDGARRAASSAAHVEPIPAGMSLDDAPAVPLAVLRAVGAGDPRSAERLAALAARIDAAAAPELARRAAVAGVRVLPLRPRGGAAVVTAPRTGDDALACLARALRPSLVAAAAALLAALALGRGDERAVASAVADPMPAQLVAEATAAQALAVDAQDAEWIGARQVPSDDELVRAIAAGGVR